MDIEYSLDIFNEATLKDVEEFIPTKEKYIEFTEKLGFTPLYLICKRFIRNEKMLDLDPNKKHSKDLKVCKQIINYFIDIDIPINLKNIDGKTPVNILVSGSKESADILEILIENDLDVPFNIFETTDHVITGSIKKVLNRYLNLSRLVTVSKVMLGSDKNNNMDITIREIFYMINNYKKTIADLSETDLSEKHHVKFTINKLSEEINRLQHFLKEHNLIKDYQKYEKVHKITEPDILKHIGTFLFSSKKSKKKSKKKIFKRKFFR